MMSEVGCCATQPASARRVAHHFPERGAGTNTVVASLETYIEPVIGSGSLFVTNLATHGRLEPAYIVLGLIVFVLMYPGRNRLRDPLYKAAAKLTAIWLFMVAMLLTFAWGLRFIEFFDLRLLQIWAVSAPVAMIIVHGLFRLSVPLIHSMEDQKSYAVIVGANQQGVELARRMQESPYNDQILLGYFDDRNVERLAGLNPQPLLGTMAELPDYVRKHHVNTLFLALPMASQPRILDLLDQLRDTTASIYFVPDLFVTDLVQGRMHFVGGMPVMGVCDTPFVGWSGVQKRLSDILISLSFLILASPILLGIAALVKLTSPGPVIFKQRRYGLDGKEIVVYKFRSMTVCEDGDKVVQAKKNDQRLTPIGGFLRKSSLDELPQFINVLQGRMSVVGPRPHAVSHNEMYRKVIKGYMVRHKVRPGITGWAQVNGYRGETDTLDKMEKRVEYDLDYLRNWSLRFDIYIIMKTFMVFTGQKNAY